MPIKGGGSNFAGVTFSKISRSDAIASLVEAATHTSAFTTVVTPNVDHVVRMDRLGGTELGERYRAAVRDADYCFCDSRVLARLARLRGIRLSLIPGSDLTAELFAAHISRGMRVALIGGNAEMLGWFENRYPDVSFSQHVPPMGMIDDPEAMDSAAQFIVDCKSNFTFIAVGSPQGEILAARARQLGAIGGVALSVGASLAFVSGQQQRAPAFVQRLGFEWAHRILTDPKRLWRRYLVDAPRVFAIVLRPIDLPKTRKG